MANHGPDTAASHNPGERLPAVWPWLLIPLVALALFFALRSVRSDTAAAPAASTAPTISSPDDGSPTNVR
jgi:hypothetical protein